MGVQQIATAAPLRGIPKGAAARPCLQGIVCYTSAERIGDGRQPDVLLMLSAAWMQIVF